MGIANIPSATDGTPIPASDHNAIANALKGDLVPRNSSGNATANAGNLGTNTFPFTSAKITVGYLFPGCVTLFHDYNGLLTPGQGWMKLNGDIVNEANYDALHGAGSWDLYIVSSPLDGKYLPNMANRYPVGTAATTQAGTVAITKVGNTNHQVALPSHSHTGPSHNHKWYESAAGASNDTSFSSSGTSQNLGPIARALNEDHIKFSTAAEDGVRDSWTSNDGTGNTGSSVSATISHQPDSMEFEYWMRIV